MLYEITGYIPTSRMQTFSFFSDIRKLISCLCNRCDDKYLPTYNRIPTANVYYGQVSVMAYGIQG